MTPQELRERYEKIGGPFMLTTYSGWLESRLAEQDMEWQLADSARVLLGSQLKKSQAEVERLILAIEDIKSGHLEQSVTSVGH